MSTISPGTTLPFDDDHFHEECAVFGVWGAEGAAGLTALGLHALQHRGQESAGIVSYDGEQFHSHRAIGLVGDHFNAMKTMNRLVGDAAVGVIAVTLKS